MGAFAG